MKWESITLSSPTTPCTTPNSNTKWLVEDRRSTKFTPEENKLFENALAVYDKDTPDRWHKVAEMIPGKTVVDVIRQYKELEVDVSNIEAGLVPVPDYSSTATSPFTLDWVNTSGYDGFKGSGKRSSSVRPHHDHERKKGVPWTEEEHKLFLLGLKKYGKGDWRNISRNFVITRTPTQVASHAQKYFIRQLSGGKDKRRASIHDITTVNLTETIITTSSSEDTNVLPQQHPNSTPTTPRTHFQWSNHSSTGLASAMTLNNHAHERVFMSPYGVNNSFGVKIEGQNSALHESSYNFGPQTQNMVFQMQQQSSQH